MIVKPIIKKVDRAKLRIAKVKLYFKFAKEIGWAIIFHAFRIALAYFYIIAIMIGIGLILKYTFLSRTFDTTTLTNVGFALFAVSANVCFSWSRTIVDNNELVSKINFNAERLLLSAFAFLFASILKYLYFQKDHIISLISHWTVFLGFEIVFYSFCLIFFYAYLMACGGIYELLSILLFRHVNQPKIKELNKITNAQTEKEAESKDQNLSPA